MFYKDDSSLPDLNSPTDQFKEHLLVESTNRWYFLFDLIILYTFVAASFYRFDDTMCQSVNADRCALHM